MASSLLLLKQILSYNRIPIPTVNACQGPTGRPATSRYWDDRCQTRWPRWLWCVRYDLLSQPALVYVSEHDLRPLIPTSWRRHNTEIGRPVKNMQKWSIDEYIVHGYNNQRLKPTLVRSFRNERYVSTRFDRPWSHIGDLWLDPDTTRFFCQILNSIRLRYNYCTCEF